MNEHKIPLEQLYQQVKSSFSGLSSVEAKERLKIHGFNILETKKKIPAVLKFLKQFKNFFALLLIAGSLIAFFAEYILPGEGNLYIGIALAGVVVLNAIFTFVQEYQSEKIMESFKKMLPQKASVIRDGKIQEIEANEIVPGDIIFLNEGEKVPADARLIEQNSLKVDNSSITGESEPQLRKLEYTHKNILESRNMVFSGTLVQSGNGKALVYGTGINTQIGDIVKLTKETEGSETPLRKELNHFIKVISTIAIILSLVFFITSFFIGNTLIRSIIFAIGIIVANVPEGLLPTVTLCLSIASKRMAKKNALIKNLESVETLGSTTVICTDKTGTITQNKMTVNTLFVNSKETNASEKGINNIKGLNLLIKTMVLCNNSKLNTNDKSYSGDPTETSLMNFSQNFIDIEKLIMKEERIHESPFDSKTKRMITTNKSAGKKIAYMKGAPEIIINKCNKILVENKIRSLSKRDKLLISNYYEKLASRGERVLAFSYKETKTEKAKENNFIFLGLVGMLDPPRIEVFDAIKKCKTAGIKVIMITGDYSLTAESIARKVGLVDHEKATIITGDELKRMSEKKLKEELKKQNIIFARINPIQKLKIVKTLQSMGEIVTVTGDGVNDAPALKNADMGVAMGLSGTEVAREASDMVLMDDNFATIVNAVEEGRTIFENIKKFIAYILTSNIPEILPFIAFVLLGLPLPLSIILILAIDLGTDILPAIGLGIEKPEIDVMKNKPRSRKERLLTPQLLFMSYGIIGMLQAIAGFFSYFVVLFNGGWTWGQQLALSNPLYQKAVTAFFASIIICQIADVWICRTRRQSVFKSGFSKNKVILLGIMIELIILSIVVYLPGGNVFFGTQPLTAFEILLSVPFALIILFGDELRKIFIRKENRFVLKYLVW
ncbi:MAG: HAD-IC family P-type ATPase [Nanoarchaeota archaeon]|nr:HAD-IC family P-type ATPase [Nanoarchaeota archaeon]MBU1849962.1 HAD-IC family P-type ATPase [Nanoarchaeota archaeon]